MFVWKEYQINLYDLWKSLLFLMKVSKMYYGYSKVNKGGWSAFWELLGDFKRKLDE